MKKVMLQGLLLIAAMGYFFAGLHTVKHIGLPHALHASSLDVEHSSSENHAPDTVDADDCLICTVLSHTAAILPPLESPRTTLLIKETAPLQHVASPSLPRSFDTLGARAPPYC